MSKTIFCFIGKEPVEVQDEKALAKLCPEHDTPENREIMLNTPVKQLLAIQNEGLKLYLENSLNNVENTTKTDIQLMMTMLKTLQEQVTNLSKENTTEVSQPTISNIGTVNEYGEII